MDKLYVRMTARVSSRVGLSTVFVIQISVELRDETKLRKAAESYICNHS